ncbi:MAG: hypothetical protein B6U78_02430 [Candidatus Aenigmarchaeota archaeon ex4484_224]|nr:MAG: hypothetical protein B6U78_02430 [Candidatus Aenigmarchaeota archaeon ex4484_224]
MGICIKCGTKTEKLYDSLCINCFRNELSKLKIKIPKTIEIKQCRVCKKYLIGNKYIDDIEKAIKNQLEKIFSKEENLVSFSFEIFSNKIIVYYQKEKYEIKAFGKIELNLRIKEFVCPICQRKLGKEFNSIVQLRGKNLEKIVEEIKKIVEKKKRKDSFISKIEKVKNGYDLYFFSKSIAKQVVNYLRRKYKVEIKFSRKLYGLKNGKKFYKDTIAVRFYE